MIQWKITAGRSGGGGGSSPLNIYIYFFLIICEDKTV